MNFLMSSAIVNRLEYRRAIHLELWRLPKAGIWAVPVLLLRSSHNEEWFYHVEPLCARVGTFYYSKQKINQDKNK
jgi:hypothetical protein